ncbi:MAG: cobalamin-dependent protein [Campylobacterota bacterium]|nr:cobalamin-dependent protein [Campylobacterota bacterium]
MDTLIQEFEDALLSLDRIKIREILSSRSDSGGAIPLLEDVVIPAMDSIGQRWEDGGVALSQVYMGGKILEEIVDELIPKKSIKRVDQPNIAILVYKDYHLLGKRIVYTFLKSNGYDVIDYGLQHSIESIIKKIKQDKIQILLISVLMLNSAINTKELISKIKDEKLNTKVVVGGAPFRFDADLYREVGADAYATNAFQAVDIIEKLKGLL